MKKRSKKAPARIRTSLLLGPKLVDRILKASLPGQSFVEACIDLIQMGLDSLDDEAPSDPTAFLDAMVARESSPVRAAPRITPKSDPMVGKLRDAISGELPDLD